MPTESQSKKPGGIEFYGGYQVYSDSGVDLTLLRENLKRPIEERILRNTRMLPLLEELRRSAPANSPGRRTGTGRATMLEVQGILQQLAKFHVKYVLIGGLAMRAHGSAHLTEDLVICYARTRDNLEAMASAFAPLHPYLRGAPEGLPFRFDAATLQAGLNFTLQTDLGDVDVLGEVSGVGNYEKAYSQSEEKQVFGVPVRVLSLDGLIAAKKAAARIKDQGHLLELEELKKILDSQKEK